MTASPHPPMVHGLPPLTARLEPWMEELLADPDAVADLVARYGSPVNLLDFAPFARNVADLLAPCTAHRVAARVFVARKANKAVGLVDAALAGGHGVDVASYDELRVCLERGVPGSDLVVSAAVKSPALLRLAVDHGAAVSLDNADELAALRRVTTEAARPARVALRLAVQDASVPPTRFGLGAEQWAALAASGGLDGQQVEGVHFHLNGYSAPDRVVALRAAVELVDTLRAGGHPVAWVDMGGGVPMSYLVDRGQWRDFWQRLAAQEGDEVTWRGDRLGMVDPSAARPSPATYPFWQSPVRGAWLDQVLSAAGPGGTVAELLRSRDLTLHLEPGRAVLDGCGMTVAEVAFRKTSSDGVPLVGLHMNRTQVRSTSADFLLDPIWLRPSTAGEPGAATDGFLVGAYCIEEELLARRRFHFPRGVACGDLAVFPNTAGYLMHIVESASHQLPLARNLVRGPAGFSPDPADRVG